MGPILYILMRTDLDSLTPGKAMAQAVHAGNALESHFETTMQITATSSDKLEQEYAKSLSEAFYAWKHQTDQDFGTTIVLGGSMSKIKVDIECLQRNKFLAAVVHDPTYPLGDGAVTHLIPLDTCAYVFAPDKDNQYLRMILDSYNLHP